MPRPAITPQNTSLRPSRPSSDLGTGTVGTGAGAFRPGNGVTTPRLLATVKPDYTAAAMRNKIQGIVAVQRVVDIDGTVRDIRVLRSLDPTWGLDEQAVIAAKNRKFSLGTRNGIAVPVEIVIELQFTVR
jgi:protein TonB